MTVCCYGGKDIFVFPNMFYQKIDDQTSQMRTIDVLPPSDKKSAKSGKCQDKE